MIRDKEKLEYHMRLHEAHKLYSDAIIAVSCSFGEGGLGVNDILIEKGYWINHSLQLLSQTGSNGFSIFKSAQAFLQQN